MPSTPSFATRGRRMRAGATGAARGRSLVLLAAALLLVAGALYQAVETVRSHRRTAARLVSDYGAFAAWSYRHRATELLRTQLRWTFAPVAHAGASDRRAGSLTAAGWRAALGAAMATAPCGECGQPSYHFRLPLRGAHDVPDSAVELAGVPVGDGTRRWVRSTILTHAVGPTRADGDFAVVRAADGGQERALAYVRIRHDSATVMVYGFEIEPARYTALFRTLFATGQLLPPAVTGQRDNAALLGVQVLAPNGAVVHRSSDPGGWAATTVDRLDAQVGGFEVHAAILRRATASLAGGGLPGARLPLMIGLLALAGGLALVAVYQSRREAQLTRLRADFVAGVSHELRTPLAQVQLFLETLRLGRYRTEAQREWILDGMQRETTRLTALVDNVLHVANAERSGPGVGAREPTRLCEYVREVIAEFAPLAGARGVTLEPRCEQPLVASLHRESFRRALLNLLDNAVKYGPERGTVLVTTSASDAEGDVRITVEDRGPGVDPREAEVIFEPFRRGARAIGSVTTGSGIGLSVARDIVEAHGGWIRVEPNPAGGARFVIELRGSREPAADGAPVSNGDRGAMQGRT